MLAREVQLGEIAEREKVVYLQETAEAKDVCSKALSKSNMTWNGRHEYYGQDDFTLELPADFTSPMWADSPGMFVDQARLDILNSGEKSDVYRISYQDSRIQYTWYIVARPEEKAEIERRLKQPDGFAALASRPIQTSATELYRGWYTRSTVAQYKGKTYIIAESVNNREGPTFAVFKPQQPGRLVAQCYFRATPSLVVESRKQLDPSYLCPADLKQLETALDRDPCGTNSAQIDLKEWGGKRPVTQEGTELARGVCGARAISVGAVGQERADTNSWPLSNVLNANGRLYLTEQGPYVVSEQQSGELYYRIVENTLKPVCQTSRRTVAPPAYRRKETSGLSKVDT